MKKLSEKNFSQNVNTVKVFEYQWSEWPILKVEVTDAERKRECVRECAIEKRELLTDLLQTFVSLDPNQWNLF